MSGLPPPPRRAAGPQNSAPNSPVLEPPSSPYKHDSTTFGFRNFVDPAKYPFSDPNNFGMDALTLVKDVKETLDGAAVNFDGIRTTQNLILERQDVILERQDAIVGRQDTMQAALDVVSIQAGVTAIELRYLEDKVDAGFAAIDERFERLEEDVHDLGERMTSVEQRLTGVEQRLTGVEKRIGGVETAQTEILSELKRQGQAHLKLLMSISERLDQKVDKRPAVAAPVQPV